MIFTMSLRASNPMTFGYLIMLFGIPAMDPTWQWKSEWPRERRSRSDLRRTQYRMIFFDKIQIVEFNYLLTATLPALVRSTTDR